MAAHAAAGRSAREDRRRVRNDYGRRVVASGRPVNVDALLAFAASSKSFEEYDAARFLRWPALPQRGRRKRAKPRFHNTVAPAAPGPQPTSQPAQPVQAPVPKRRGGMPKDIAERARTFVREQLADGPRRQLEIEAEAVVAAIPLRSLIVAADALGVRCRRGEWRLPG